MGGLSKSGRIGTSWACCSSWAPSRYRGASSRWRLGRTELLMIAKYPAAGGGSCELIGGHFGAPAISRFSVDSGLPECELNIDTSRLPPQHAGSSLPARRRVCLSAGDQQVPSHALLALTERARHRHPARLQRW